MPDISVILPAHNPGPARFGRTLQALRDQTLPPDTWETILIDNASAPPIRLEAIAAAAPKNLRLVREPEVGLSVARRRGLANAQAPLCVFVDDDNVLAADYLARAKSLAANHPSVGAFGGKSLPEFERPPPPWAAEFYPLLALRDLGDQARISPDASSDKRDKPSYPIESAPIGAGMVLRREAVATWLSASAAFLPDRRGAALTSGGDNEIVFSVLGAGWRVGYFPELSLTHLVPAARIAPDYLARLNRGIQGSWMKVLSKHNANPWPPVARWSVPLRQLKAWFTYRAWSSPAAHIRWQGACGHLEGRRRAASAS